jgi:hypothetical protein
MFAATREQISLLHFCVASQKTNECTGAPSVISMDSDMRPQPDLTLVRQRAAMHGTPFFLQTFVIEQAKSFHALNLRDHLVKEDVLRFDRRVTKE